MAGMGKRMRPHTLTTPKPLLPVAGKSIVERLVESIHAQVKGQIQEIAFVIGAFGPETEQMLLDIAQKLGAKGSIHYQAEALGTAHAIYCAKDALHGPVVVAFADTLFDGSFDLKPDADATIWVKKIADPSSFGVVEMNENQVITRFVEKPKTFVSDLAIIGIYHFKDGLALRQEIEYLFEHRVIKSGEYQLTDVLENMKNQGKTLRAGEVSQWLDFGNKEVFIESVAAILEKTPSPSDLTKQNNSTIIPPCYLGKNVQVNGSTIGPNVSIEDNSVIEDCVLSNTIIMKNSKVISSKLNRSMIGNHVYIKDNKQAKELNIGDYNSLEYVAK